MSIRAVLQAFATVFPAELPDKTMIASIVLVARYRRPLWVWVGAASAFAVHVVVAVAAGSAIGLLPKSLVSSVVAVLFSVGAVLLFRAGRAAEAEAAEAAEADAADAEGQAAGLASIRVTVIGSFGVIVLAEWGDLTQLATASLAAKSDQPVSIGIGAYVALMAVAAIAASFGRQIVARFALHKVNYVGAAVFAGLAIWTVVELLA
jgi:putative Ca2+/H+ antiporter (TMEM165/GDT1 family)